MPCILYTDAFSYIAEGIRIAHADYSRRQRKAFPSPKHTICTKIRKRQPHHTTLQMRFCRVADYYNIVIYKFIYIKIYINSKEEYTPITTIIKIPNVRL